MKVQMKKFVIIPRDAMELLDDRSVDLASAKLRASELCGETGLAHYVVELKAVATREHPPVRVRTL